MATVAFDTLKFSKRLQEAGVPAVQADAEASALAEALAGAAQQLADKSDIALLRSDIERFKDEIRRDIKEMHRDIKELEMRLTIKLGGLLALAVGLVATLTKLL